MATRPQPSGADTLRAAAAYLDRFARAVARRARIDAELDQLARDRPPGVTQEQVAQLLGITPRGLRKRLTTPRAHDPLAAVEAAEHAELQERPDGDA